MVISELVDTIHAYYILPETDETREVLATLRKAIVKQIRQSDNDDWLMKLLCDLMNYSPKGD